MRKLANVTNAQQFTVKILDLASSLGFTALKLCNLTYTLCLKGILHWNKSNQFNQFG